VRKGKRKRLEGEWEKGKEKPDTIDGVGLTYTGPEQICKERRIGQKNKLQRRKRGKNGVSVEVSKGIGKDGRGGLEKEKAGKKDPTRNRLGTRIGKDAAVEHPGTPKLVECRD